jgi:GT2 family glycosyltransferase
MSVISMAVHDTEENGRSAFTRRTLQSLSETVDWSKHRMFIIDNGSCKETKTIITSGILPKQPVVITLDANIGTAEALNLAWKERNPGEHCIKIDNDVVIHSAGWVEEMEDAVRRNPLIGQVGLKRKDCMEGPERTDWYRSELIMLPHESGECWIIAEKCNHIMGTCVLHSSALLDKVGYLKQPGLYGFDDSFMSLRSQLAGFINIFLPHINIDHIDPGGTDYTTWKQEAAAARWAEYHKAVAGYRDGSLPLYYNPFQ